MTTATMTDAPRPAPARRPAADRAAFRARRAENRRHRARLVDELLAHLGRPEPSLLDRQAGIVALSFTPADRHAERLETVCHLGAIRMVCLRHRWRDGRPSLPLTLHRFELDPVSATIHGRMVAAYDLAAEAEATVEGSAGPLRADDGFRLATLAVCLRHAVLEEARDELPAAPPLMPEFLFGFEELPAPSPLVFEANPAVTELAIDAGCDTDEVWRRLQGHVLLGRGGRITGLPHGTPPPGLGELPDGTRLYATWPSHLFARDAATRYEAHPVDGSPRPADETPEALPPGWFASGGAVLPTAQRPDRVLVRLPIAGAGRQMRNPAWSALRKYGLIAWKGGLSGFRARLQAGWPRVLERYAARYPGRRDRIGLEVHHLCVAFGLPSSRGEVERMLRDPAEPLAVPGLPGVQLFRPAWAGGAAPVLAGPGYHFELSPPTDATANVRLARMPAPTEWPWAAAIA